MTRASAEQKNIIGLPVTYLSWLSEVSLTRGHSCKQVHRMETLDPSQTQLKIVAKIFSRKEVLHRQIIPHFPDNHFRLFLNPQHTKTFRHTR